MKKAIVIFLSLLIVLNLTACGSPADQTVQLPTEDNPVESSTGNDVSNAIDNTGDAQSTSIPQAQPEETPTPTQEPMVTPEVPGTNALVVYFSRSGNTETVAMEIQSQTDADVFRIVPAEPYVDDYNTLLDVAREEQRSNARPAIAGSVGNMDAYDTIYLGYPNWWGDMPMILYSFLDDYDLSDKTIAPFCTSGGSGLSRTVGTIQAMEPDATVLKGLHIEDSDVSRSRGPVTHWLGELGLTA